MCVFQRNTLDDFFVNENERRSAVETMVADYGVTYSAKRRKRSGIVKSICMYKYIYIMCHWLVAAAWLSASRRGTSFGNDSPWFIDTAALTERTETYLHIRLNARCSIIWTFFVERRVTFLQRLNKISQKGDKELNTLF